jgi:hypothetical protein
VTRSSRRLLVVIAALIAFLGVAPHVAAEAPPDSVPAAPVTINEFIPEEVDLGDCISSVPRPECGSDNKGDWRFYAVMGVMVAGMGFIAWRIARGVRARDRALDPQRQPVATPTDDP